MHNHKTDEADRFREMSLKAIRNRKKYAKVVYYLCILLAIVMMAIVIFAYFFDK